MASLAIKSVIDAQCERQSLVSFFYCNYERNDEQSIHGLLSALLRQFVSKSNLIPNCIIQLHQLCQKQQRRPTQEELEGSFISIASSHDGSFLIIDAIDELTEDTRRRLLSWLHQARNKAPIRCLITSRPLPGISQHFVDDLQLEIRANKTDIELNLHKRLDELSIIVQDDETLKQNITHGVAEAVDGM